MLSVKTAGHVGTLDPNATGVLPILLGRATRVALALERSDKTYVATIHFHLDIGEAELKEVLSKFIGTILQKPPVKSAVARRERERKVYSIDILCKDGKDVRLRVACEAGTYIRKLASDVGLLVGGAHLKDLRRTRAGPFDEKQAHTIEELRSAVETNSPLRAGNDTNSPLSRIILPVERAVSNLPKVVVNDSSTAKVMNGSPLFAADISRIDDFDDDVLVAIVSTKGELLALGKRSGKAIRIDRVVKA
jgi:H/ACA ribonucleoprotein complex subunit 4